MHFESEDFKEIISYIRENELTTPYFICSCKFSDDEKDSITYVTDKLVVSDMIDDAILHSFICELEKTKYTDNWKSVTISLSVFFGEDTDKININAKFTRHQYDNMCEAFGDNSSIICEITNNIKEELFLGMANKLSKTN